MAADESTADDEALFRLWRFLERHNFRADLAAHPVRLKLLVALMEELGEP